MLPISVCMIAKNEDLHIEDCLKRLRPCRFEIIVVDTGSVDRTVENARKYTDKVYHFDWCSDFSAARNYSISQASNDWILVIDCDEYLENINLADIKESLNGHQNCVGTVVRNNPYIIQGVRSIMTERIGRLFNRRCCHYEGSIHEQVTTLDGKEPETFPIALTFYHEGYVSESGKRMRATRNLEMLLHDLELKGASQYIYFQLGQNYISLNDLEKAAYYFKLGLDLNPGPNSTLIQDMTESYGYCLVELARYDAALELKDKYDLFSGSADFLYLMGLIYMKKNMPEQALEEFAKASSIPCCSRKGVNSYRAYYNMASIYEQLGQKDKAKEYYGKCGDFSNAAKRLEEL